MRIDKAKPNGGTVEYKRPTYYFCCRGAFSKEPEAYLSGGKGVKMPFGMGRCASVAGRIVMRLNSMRGLCT